jgi:hypothetical protein
MGARGLSYRPARLQEAGGIHSLASIPGLHTRLKIRALIAGHSTLLLGILPFIICNKKLKTEQETDYESSLAEINIKKET